MACWQYAVSDSRCACLALALEGVEIQTILLMIEPESYHDHSYRQSEL